jgi:hypothetical protein
VATATQAWRGTPRTLDRQCRPSWETARCPSCRARCATQGYLRRDNVFRPTSLAIAFRAAPSEHYPITPQEYPCVATAACPRRNSLTCHADTCSNLPLHAGTLAVSHNVHSRVRHFQLWSTCGQIFLRLRQAGRCTLTWCGSLMALVAERATRPAGELWSASCLRSSGGGMLERDCGACGAGTHTHSLAWRVHPFAVIMRCLSQVE